MILHALPMARQEDGWPLGLQPLNMRVGLARHGDLSGSVSFNTLLTASPISSSASSSQLDTESTGSFFQDKSITLGSLIGISSSILELSRRSTRGRTAENLRENLRDKKINKSKTWLFSLCSKLSTDAVRIDNTPCLGHFLEAERRAATNCKRNQSPNAYKPDDFSNLVPVLDNNSLFVSGNVAPPPPPPSQSSSVGWDGENRSNTGLFEYGPPIVFSRLCGNLSH